jgi:acyl carrier protein phosphodiesterase
MQILSLVNVQPTKQQLVDYLNALISVNNYAYAITNQQMPTLKSPPARYADFVDAFAPAQKTAIIWSNGIFVNAITIPNIIIQYADIFADEKLVIELNLQILISNGSNQQAKNNVSKALTDTIKIVTRAIIAVQNLEKRIEKFATNIQAEANTLSTMAASALEMVKEDKEKIQALNNEIQNLNDAIKSAQTLLTIAEIGVPISIFVGLIGAVVCVIPGGQVVGGVIITVAVAGVAASIAVGVVEYKKIKALQETIKTDYEQISVINQDVILLQAVSQQFNDLCEANAVAQKALSAIKLIWMNMLEMIQKVNSELIDVNAELTSSYYTDALNLFQQAAQDWNEVVTFATTLESLNYSWQDTSGNWHKYTDVAPDLDDSKIEMIRAQADPPAPSNSMEAGQMQSS